VRPVVYALLIVLGVISLFMLINSMALRGSCAYYGYQTDREVRYAAFVGCMVKVNEAWIPRNELRVVQ
jgi:hypothetical protein